MKTFRLRWEVRGKQHLTEMCAATAGDARQAFNAYRLPGVLLTSVEPVEPDAAIPPVSTQPPELPLSPLSARRKTITDPSRFGALARGPDQATAGIGYSEELIHASRIRTLRSFTNPANPPAWPACGH